jgi:enamine deaminase RidA (YjgF/YER057c/UK114 family)
MPVLSGWRKSDATAELCQNHTPPGPVQPSRHLQPKETTMSIKRHGVGPRLSQAVVHGNTVYLAGIVAGDPSADAKGQTEQILKKIDEHLAATGSHKSKLLSATIYLANMALYGDMNSVWDAWVDPANTPARATVEARLAAPRYLVEIMVVAAI